MRIKDSKRAEELDYKLLLHSTQIRELLGVASSDRRSTLIEQILESIRRVQYIQTVRNKTHSKKRKDPSDPAFDPLKAAVVFYAEGELEEACWLIFLATHFGKHGSHKWKFTKDVYGALGTGRCFTWRECLNDPGAIDDWMCSHFHDLKLSSGKFGNHRKYESFKPGSKRYCRTIESYIAWILKNQTHAILFKLAGDKAQHDPRKAFRNLYNSMTEVKRFGRTARFDYLAMIGNLGLAEIIPDSGYVAESSGPLAGAKLLYGKTAQGVTKNQLDEWLVELADSLDIGMQEMEDSLCNWQKSPNYFIPFRG